MRKEKSRKKHYVERESETLCGNLETKKDEAKNLHICEVQWHC